MHQKRRASRVEAHALIQVLGVDETLVPRLGNFSVGGMYIAISEPVAGPGAIGPVRIASLSGRLQCEIVVRTVRRALSEQNDGVRQVGAAFEFLPDSEYAIRQIQGVVRGILDEGHIARGRISPFNEASHLTNLETTPTSMASATSESILLDDELFTFGRRHRGARDTGRFSGVLSQLALPSLLNFFAFERLTGYLELNTTERSGFIFMHDGTIVDADWSFDSIRSDNPKEILKHFWNANQGQFHFEVGPINREHRLTISVTTAMLELATEFDEAER